MNGLRIIRNAALGLVLAAGVGAGLLVTPATTAAPSAEQSASSAAPFAIDAVHSTVIFRIKHLNVAYNYGRFNDLSGSFHIDPTAPEKSVLEVTINVDSVDTANEDRDKHLRSPDFFSTAEHPKATFKSTSAKKTGENTYEFAGDLTIKGVTKQVTLSVEDTGRGPGRRGGEVAGIETKLVIQRADFGIDYLPNGLGSDVTLIIALEGSRK